MKNKKILLSTALLVNACVITHAQINVDVNAGIHGDTISDKQYGIFFEEINHAGDGGLYAETIRNRSFEGEFEPSNSWHTFGSASMMLEKANETHSNMLSKAQGYAMKVTTLKSGAGLYNEGYWGINIVKGRQYKLSIWAKGVQAGTRLTAKFFSADTKITLGQIVIVDSLTTGWKKYTADIVATGNDTEGLFCLTAGTATTFYVDMVSLLPPTYKNRDNGCRPDLAQMLENLQPKFMRFPGGCYVEGIYNSTTKKNYRYLWKNTLGPQEDRLPQYDNNWGYDVNNGMGVYEFFQFCEDIKASPLYVVNIGIGHQWITDYKTEIGNYIQEALDLIEFANGDTTTTYGKIRKQMGHEAPFNLKLIEIGNENYNNDGYQGLEGTSDHYVERYRAFRKAILAKYPYMELISNGYDSNVWSDNEVEYVDEHYYMSPEWFISQYGRYDNSNKYSHKKVYVGEYAVTVDWGADKGDIKAALGEAVFMEGMEKNSAYVKMASYAPIFYDDKGGGWWQPDMIHFSPSASYGTPSYYIQKLFPENIGQYNVQVTETNNVSSKVGSVGFGTWMTSASFDDVKVTDNLTGDVIIQDDFTTSNSSWNPTTNTWTTTKGVITQSDSSKTNALNVNSSNLKTPHYTYTVTAIKNKGDEGFLIPFNYIDDSNYTWFNVGGWANTGCGIEQCSNGSSRTVNGTVKFNVKEGQAYKIKIIVDSLNVRAYIDNVLIQECKIAPSSLRNIYTSANIDSTNSVVYLRIVNPYDKEHNLNVNLHNADILSVGGQILSGTSATDENTPSNPKKVVPNDMTGISISGNSFTLKAPAYSANFINIKVSNVTMQKPEQVSLPSPILKYDFEEGGPTDSTKTYKGKFVSKAKIQNMSDNNNVLYTGNKGEGGYMDLGGNVANATFSSLGSDYSLSVDLMFGENNNLGSFCWPYAFCNGSEKYVALVNTAGNGNWYYEIKNSSASTSHSNTGISTGKWHNVTFVQNAENGIIYVDGVKKGSESIYRYPADFAASLTNAYFGKSPYSGDAIMENMYLDNFSVYSSALSSDQVKNIWSKTTSMSTVVSTTNDITKPTVKNAETGIYSINGVKIGEKYTDLDNIQKSIFIINKKKILKK